MKRLPIPWGDRAIVISEVTDPASWFSDREREAIGALRLEKRREEWMLSRIAAKQLAIDRGICPDALSCLLEDRRIGSWHVSLSHSGTYAAAAIDRSPIGIDVQVVRELKEPAAHLFLSDSEEEAMRSLTVPHRLLHFWCAKEAAWKKRGGEIPTLKQIPLKVVAISPNGLRFDEVETVAIEEVIVALTTSPSSLSPRAYALA